jgi:hypothetical protein
VADGRRVDVMIFPVQRDVVDPASNSSSAPLVHWSGLSGQDDPFYPHAVPRQELSYEFLACLTGKLIEQDHHSCNRKDFQ